MKVKDYYSHVNFLDDDDSEYEDYLNIDHIDFDWVNYNDISVHYGEILGIKHEVNDQCIDRFYIGWYGLDSNGYKRFRKVIGFNKLPEAKKAFQEHVNRLDFFGDPLKKIPKSKV